jgi:hypothetical protein
MLILRHLKRSFFMNREFRRYLGYAVGEILLVIVGILIALRIDTWHEERQTQQAIDEYLAGVARNIREDIAEIQAIRAKREAAMFAAKLARWSMGWLTSYTLAEIEYASDALALAREQHYFNANTSSYEGLRNSGLLSNLGDPEIESLLFEYYELVSRIRQFEQNQNEYLRGLSLQFTSHAYGDLMLAFQEPGFFDEEMFAGSDLQSGFRGILRDPIVLAWFESASLQSLLLDYMRLENLGMLYIGLVEGAGNDTTLSSRESFYDPNSGLGYARVLDDGELAWHSYTVEWYPTPDNEILENRGTFASDIRAISFSGESMDVSYPGIERLGGPNWAAVALRVGGIAPTATRGAKDYSRFKSLRLDMKGARGGEQFSIHLKDSSDADDGTQTNIPVTLTEDWQTYDFDLASFESADLSRLFIVTGFLFIDQPEPLSFSVRNVTFLKPGDP